MSKIIKGRAAVIRKVSDYYRINGPVIIVAKNTTPDITVVMSYVTAIITEIDNKLCHAAIIAREYGKPLLMGQAGITRKLKNGDMIEVDIIKKSISKK